MKYELRFDTGEVHQWVDAPALTPEQRAIVLSGHAELVRIDDHGQTELIDVDEVTEVSTEPVWLEPGRRAAALVLLKERGEPPFPSPVLSIRVCHSESPMLPQGTAFQSITDFDAALSVARVTSAPISHAVSFCITWRSGATFQSSIDLFGDVDEGLSQHITRVCAEVLKDPTRKSLMYAARLTIMRALMAAVVESTARCNDAVHDGPDLDPGLQIRPRIDGPWLAESGEHESFDLDVHEHPPAQASPARWVFRRR